MARSRRRARNLADGIGAGISLCDGRDWRFILATLEPPRPVQRGGAQQDPTLRAKSGRAVGQRKRAEHIGPLQPDTIISGSVAAQPALPPPNEARRQERVVLAVLSGQDQRDGEPEVAADSHRTRMRSLTTCWRPIHQTMTSSPLFKATGLPSR